MSKKREFNNALRMKKQKKIKKYCPICQTVTFHNKGGICLFCRIKS